MKKLYILFITTAFLSCETQTIEVENSAGMANNDGEKYVFGSDEDSKMAIDLVLAYADKDTDAMYEMMADTVRYAPPSGGLMVNSREDVPEIVMQLHSPYDSIKRTVWNAVPLKREGSDVTRVTVAFLEDRYMKDGAQEKVRIIDRIFIRDGKIFRIHQWDAKME